MQGPLGAGGLGLLRLGMWEPWRAAGRVGPAGLGSRAPSGGCRKNDWTVGGAGKQTSTERGRTAGCTQAQGKQRAEKLVGSAFLSQLELAEFAEDLTWGLRELEVLRPPPGLGLSPCRVQLR